MGGFNENVEQRCEPKSVGSKTKNVMSRQRNAVKLKHKPDKRKQKPEKSWQRQTLRTFRLGSLGMLMTLRLCVLNG